MPQAASSVPSDPVNDHRTEVPEPNAAVPPKRIPEATVLRLPVYQRILEELLRSGNGVDLIDVREPHEWEIGRIDGGVDWMDKENIAFLMQQLSQKPGMTAAPPVKMGTMR